MLLYLSLWVKHEEILAIAGKKPRGEDGRHGGSTPAGRLTAVVGRWEGLKKEEFSGWLTTPSSENSLESLIASVCVVGRDSR